jgi:putative DNA primase/helicase
MSLDSFFNVVRSFGLEPDSMDTGRFVRFPGQGKRASNRAGWYFLSDNLSVGWFGDWSTGLSEAWRCEDAAAQQFRWQANRPGRSTTIRSAPAQSGCQYAAAERARAIWRSAGDAELCHPYLLSKQIHPYCARSYGALLVLPIVDFRGAITSLQFIASDGTKRLLRGAGKQGSFIPVADRFVVSEQIIICEGWATGCTLAELETTYSVFAAVDAGNLMSIAVGARSRWPSAKIIIAGDDDRKTPGNPGATKAKAAAIAASALLALPRWDSDAPEGLTDFNDLEIWRRGSRR